MVQELSCFLRCVVIRAILIHDKTVVGVILVEVEAVGRAVDIFVIVNDMCEDLALVAEGVEGWAPNVLQRLVHHPMALLLSIESGEDEPVKTHFRV